MAETTRIDIRLLVDKERNKVVFAECNKDFIDLLFSFLTLPLGTIVRLLDKQSQLGSIDALYQSVERLDSEYFETKACKSMLLRPRSPAQPLYRNLPLKVDGSREKYYLCPTWGCTSQTHRLISMFPGFRCLCGDEMDNLVVEKEVMHFDNDNLQGVFVKGIGKFVVGDDLKVRVVTPETSFSVFEEFGVKDGSAVEEKVVSVGINEVLSLLKQSLVSASAMTDVFLLEPKQITLTNNVMEPMYIKPEPMESKCDTKTVSLKLVIRRSTKMVLYATSEGDFTNFLISLLVIPIGGITKLCGGLSSNRYSMETLYKSVIDLCNAYPAKLKVSKEYIFDVQVAHHHSCKNSVLPVKEHPLPATLARCTTCFGEDFACRYCVGLANLRLIDPKSKETVTESSKGFVNGSVMFMITDDLLVEPLSPISTVYFINKQGVPFDDLEECTVWVGKQEALAILKASLTSKTVLADVFCQKN